LAPLPANVLLFDSNRSGNYEIFRMNVDGTDPVALTNDATFNSWWGRASPDRTRILFYRRAAAASEDYSKASLWVMNADGTDPKQLRAIGQDGWLIQGHGEWSPDGKSMVMCGTAGSATAVYITDADGQNARVVSSSGGWNCDPSWSPDGQTIVFNHCDTPGCPVTDYQINTVPAAGGALHALTNNTFANYDPYFSHDGTRIAWLVTTDPNANHTGPGDAGIALGAWGIAAIEADGGGLATIINDGQVNSKPGWSLDDATIFFHRMEPKVSFDFRIFRITPDGGGLTELAPGAPGINEYPTN
jgi:Tol biopolymer transport system component